MIAFVAIKTYGAEWERMSVEQYAELRAVVPGLPIEKPQWGVPKCWVDLRAAVPLFERLGVEVQFTQPDDVFATQMRDRLAALEEKGRLDSVTNPGWRESVAVHVPDLGLIQMNRVRVVENYCTEMLQSEIDKGWRILGVCPQPGQRRPDYVLGRAERES